MHTNYACTLHGDSISKPSGIIYYYVLKSIHFVLYVHIHIGKKYINILLRSEENKDCIKIQILSFINDMPECNLFPWG